MCAYTVITPYLFFFVDLALSVENLGEITKSRMLGRVMLYRVG